MKKSYLFGFCVFCLVSIFGHFIFQDVNREPTGNFSIEAGNTNVFQQIFSDGKSIPMPYSNLLKTLSSHINVEPITVDMLHSQSLHKEYVDQKVPRRVTAFKDLVFIAFSPRKSELEIISWNSNKNRYDFFLASDYREGGNPKIKEVSRATCLSCHQGGGPIFPRTPWAGSSFNIESSIHVLENPTYSQRDEEHYALNSFSHPDDPYLREELRSEGLEHFIRFDSTMNSSVARLIKAELCRSFKKLDAHCQARVKVELEEILNDPQRRDIELSTDSKRCIESIDAKVITSIILGVDIFSETQVAFVDEEAMENKFLPSFLSTSSNTAFDLSRTTKLKVKVERVNTDHPVLDPRTERPSVRVFDLSETSKEFFLGSKRLRDQLELLNSSLLVCADIFHTETLLTSDVTENFSNIEAAKVFEHHCIECHAGESWMPKDYIYSNESAARDFRDSDGYSIVDYLNAANGVKKMPPLNAESNLSDSTRKNMMRWIKK